MARPRRVTQGGHYFHVLNRGVRRSRLFQGEEDYLAFQRLMTRAHEHVPMRLLAYALMPNHWHLVLWPEEDGAVSAYLKWLAGTHACHFNFRHGHSGAVYQGRFRSVAVRYDLQLLRVLRYVEANPVRAGLVRRAEHWPWSSVQQPTVPPLTKCPIPRPPGWLNLLADSTLGLAEALRADPG